MDLYEVLDQIVNLLQQRKRLTYRLLKRQFALDEETLEDLKDELIYAQQVAFDEADKVLVWAGEDMTSEPVTASPKPAPQEAQPIPVESSPPPLEPPTPDAERRQLTVMFCDLADSTKLSGQLDPEDLRDVIRAYQSTSAEVIERYDGYIAQHLGDGLMVYFGWPQAHEDDAQRAVHAGLAILEAMQGLNGRLEQEKGIRLAVRIGIHTGLVVVGEIGQGPSQEHLALGETPNIASRIEGIAEPDTVVISDITYQLVQGYFVCKELGLHALKGVDDAQQVHRVVRESDAQSRLDLAVTRGLTPLVGRESESALLFERWQRVKDGQGQVVLLSGEAGIGKSRLLQVMKEHVADEAHTLLECRSSPYYQNTAFYPITDMLQPILNWSQDDTPEAKLNTLEQMLRQYTFELNEAVPLFANLLSLSIPEDRYQPLNMSPQRQRQLTLETVVAMLLQRAEQQPVLFILEDLHWTDPSTLELLDLLMDQAPTASVLALLTCRPDFEPPWGLRTYLTPIALNRFTRLQIEVMVAHVAGGKMVPTEVMQHLVEKTDGVPLYVEEMTKAILEAGVLQETDGHYELVGPLSNLSIPMTLRDSLMARLDRLGTAKGIAQVGATIGRQFDYPLLHAVSSGNEVALQRNLGHLEEAEIVYQRGVGSNTTYTFKHALIQDAAYQSLLRGTRQQYHQQIAQVLEAQFPELALSQPELLAHHFTEAGLGEQAMGYWQQAGKTALERSAHLEAIHHLQKGLAVLQGLPDTSERARHELILQTNIGSALALTRGYAAPESGQAYTRARDLCQQLDETTQLAPVLVGLRRFYLLRGELPLARQMAEELLGVVQYQYDPVRRMEAHAALGIVLAFLGEFSLAREQLEHGLDLYDPRQHDADALRQYQSPVIDCLSYMGRVLWMLGYPDQAMQRCHEALTLARELEHPYSLMYALNHTAHVHQYRREEQACRARAEAARTLAVDHGFTQWIAATTTFQGWALARQGQVREGIELSEQGVMAFRATGANLGQMQLMMLVEAYQQAGQIAEGLTALLEGITLVQQTSNGYFTADMYRLKGELLLQLSTDNQTEAETCFHQALDIARRQQAKSWELRAATSLARLWQSQGKRQAAYDLLKPVYAWFTEGFDTADLKDAKALLAELATP